MPDWAVIGVTAASLVLVSLIVVSIASLLRDWDREFNEGDDEW